MGLENAMTSNINLTYEELFEIGIKSLEIVGVPLDDAKITVEMLLSADLRGIETHGIRRLLMYIPRVRKGLINSSPRIAVQSLAPAMKILHGDNGLGPVVMVFQPWHPGVGWKNL